MRDFYQKIYDAIGNLTPIAADCGKLCQKACCEGDSDTGMYLYPGEEVMYEHGCGFAQIKPTDFTYRYDGKEQTVLMLVCDGCCERDMRPLACRIFPFAPYCGKEGELNIEIDIRGAGLCPLVQYADEAAFDETFLDAVAEAFSIATEDGRVLAFIQAQSELIDEYDELI